MGLQPQIEKECFQNFVSFLLTNTFSHKHEQRPDWFFYFSANSRLNFDPTTKLALGSNNLSTVNHKNKYEKPNIDTMVDQILQEISEPAMHITNYFSTMVLQNTYSQLKLHPGTAKH